MRVLAFSDDPSPGAPVDDRSPPGVPPLTPQPRYPMIEVRGPAGALSEQAILVGIRTGDRQVFNAICVAYHNPLWRFAVTLIQPGELAQDVVQDVLVTLWERRAEINIPTSLAAWLFSAVRKRALVMVRNSRTSARIAASWADNEVPGHGQRPESPGTATELTDINTRIRQALDQLSPVRRQVITMRWVQQMEYDEIAQVMEMSPEAVRAHVSRAYRTLRELLLSLGIDSPV